MGHKLGEVTGELMEREQIAIRNQQHDWEATKASQAIGRRYYVSGRPQHCEARSVRNTCCVGLGRTVICFCVEM